MAPFSLVIYFLLYVIIICLFCSTVILDFELIPFNLKKDFFSFMSTRIKVTSLSIALAFGHRILRVCEIPKKRSLRRKESLVQFKPAAKHVLNMWLEINKQQKKER